MIHHDKAITYSLNIIKESTLAPFIKEIILYGSVARHEERYDSDVDILLVLDEDAKGLPHRDARLLRVDVSPDDTDVDLHMTYDEKWRESTDTYFRCIQKDGIILWKRGDKNNGR